jgi:hypothetical protein
MREAFLSNLRARKHEEFLCRTPHTLPTMTEHRGTVTFLVFHEVGRSSRTPAIEKTVVGADRTKSGSSGIEKSYLEIALLSTSRLSAFTVQNASQ